MAEELTVPRLAWKGWRKTYPDTESGHIHPDLVGQGNPPGDPDFSANHPGQGQFPCSRITEG